MTTGLMKTDGKVLFDVGSLRVIASASLYECLYTDKVYTYTITITDNEKRVERVQEGQESVCPLIYGFPNIIPGLTRCECVWWICQAGQRAVPSDSGTIHFLMLSQTHTPRRSVITSEHTLLSFCTFCVISVGHSCITLSRILYEVSWTVCWGWNTRTLFGLNNEDL